MKKYRYALMALTCLTGCTSLAPSYLRPVAPVEPAWPSGPAYQAAASESHDAHREWHDLVLDPELRRLIDLALVNNRDLRMAALAIEKAQAQYQIERATLFPQLNASASDNTTATPADLGSSKTRTLSRAYNVGVGFSAYELDFFGRVRNLKEEVLEQYLATEAAHRSARTSLIAEIATTYLNLAADQEHLGLARATLQNQQTACDLVRRRFELGVSTRLDLSQAQTTVDGARGDVARYTGNVAEDQNALNLLVGTSLPDVPVAAPTSMTAFRDLARGLPSDLLQNRPDIQEAEHQLKAANLDIGVARAAFFPSISLTTAFGTASAKLSGLFKPGSSAWQFAPQINLPLFDAGSNQARLKATQVNHKIFLAQYEKTIQIAFREVADALAVQGTLGTQVVAQQSVVEATALNLKLADARFQQGVDNYLAVLDSQRSFYAAQHALINLKLAEAANRITLFKALGG